MYMFALPGLVCGSCGCMLMHCDKEPYNAARKNGVVQVICAHRECLDYDKPMEFDLPRIELRPTTAPEILSELPAPKLVVMQ